LIASLVETYSTIYAEITVHAPQVDHSVDHF
jgi:hypothetical protein